MKTKIVIFLLLCTALFQIGCDDCTPVNIDGFSKNQLTYWVQIGAFSEAKPEGDAFFDPAINAINNITFIEDIVDNGTLYRYSVGIFGDINEADDMRDVLLDSYSDAFVAIYGETNPDEYTRVSLNREQVVEVLANGCD